MSQNIEQAIRTTGTGVFHPDTRQFGTVASVLDQHTVRVRWAAPFDDDDMMSVIPIADLDVEGYDYAPADFDVAAYQREVGHGESMPEWTEDEIKSEVRAMIESQEKN